MHLVTVAAGEEVVTTVARKLGELGIRNGAIVSLIGAVESCAISTMPHNDAGTDVITEYRQPLELSGTGEIKNGTVHIHAVIGAEDNHTYSGHLHRASVSSFFVNAYVIALT